MDLSIIVHTMIWIVIHDISWQFGWFNELRRFSLISLKTRSLSQSQSPHFWRLLASFDLRIDYEPEDVSAAFKAFARNAPEGMIRVHDLREALRTLGTSLGTSLETLTLETRTENTVWHWLWTQDLHACGSVRFASRRTPAALQGHFWFILSYWKLDGPGNSNIFAFQFGQGISTLGFSSLALLCEGVFRVLSG